MGDVTILGGTITLDIPPDPALARQRKANENCKCDGLEWSARNGPHRKGSSVWCKFHPVGPSEQDLEDRYGR